MLPARNRKDFEDIPEEARKELEFVWLERVDEAVSAALAPASHDGSPGKAAPHVAALDAS
jgi:ATP-dependent Lon protease